MRKVHISLKANGTGAISIDGMDLSKVVVGIEFYSRPGEASELILRIPGPNIELHADADVWALINDLTEQDNGE